MSDEDSTAPPAPHQPGGLRGKKKVHVAGTVYGEWTLLREGEPTRRSATRWWCRCSCGREKLVLVAQLIHGSTKKCLMCSLGRQRSRRTTGVKLTLSSYNAMRKRCLNVNDAAYPRYGGSGVKICDRWLESFDNFLADMGERPGRRFSIDRIENEGNYEPGNCRWASARAQARNQRTNVLLQLGDEVLCISEWAEKLGIPQGVISRRHRSGKTDAEALTVGRLYKYGRKVTPDRKPKVAR
jgi:hypothetical protein